MGLFGPPDIAKLKAKGDVPGLIKALEYRIDHGVTWEGSDVRRQAADALADIGDRRALEPLIAVARLRPDDVAAALGRFGDARAVEPLVGALRLSPTDPAVGALVKIGAASVEALIAVLDEGSDRARYRAAGALGEIGDARAVEPLMAALKGRDQSLRTESARALGLIGDRRAVAGLVAGASDSDKGVRMAVTQALDKLGWQPDGGQAGAAYFAARGQWDKCVEIGAPAVEPLAAVLEDQKADGRAAAARALGRIGDARAVEPLTRTMWDEDRHLRESAVVALGEIGDVSAMPALSRGLDDGTRKVRIAAAQALGKIGGEAAAEILVPALADRGNDAPDPSTPEQEAALALSDWDPAHLAVLLGMGALSGATDDVREAAAEALVRIGPDAVAALVRALKRVGEEQRTGVVDVLSQIGAPAVKPLEAALADSDRWVRTGAAQALGKMGEADCVGALVPVLGDVAWMVRKAAAMALLSLHWKPDRPQDGAAYCAATADWDRCVALGPTAIGPLMVLLIGDAARDAAEALGKIGVPAVEPLMAALASPPSQARSWAAEVLGTIGDARAVGPLIAALDDGGDWRARIVIALSRIGPPALEPLVAALQSPNGAIRSGAAEALGNIGDAGAVEPFIRALGDSDAPVRTMAAQALGRLGDGRATAPLMAALGDADRTVCETAATALGEIGDPRAVDPLITALRHEGRSMRRAAASALVRIYRSGPPDEQLCARILACRGVITWDHLDKTSYTSASDCHDDQGVHTDNLGIGVDFPL